MTNIIVVYTSNLNKTQIKFLDKLGISHYSVYSEFWKIVEKDEYQACILYNLHDTQKFNLNLNVNNLILLSNKYESPRILSNKFDIDKDNINSFERKDYNEFYIRENGEFKTMDNEQVHKFIVREIKLSMLLD